MTEPRCAVCEAIMHLSDECEDCTTLLDLKRERQKTKCGKGHDWNDQNTKMRKDGNRLSRRCIVCEKESNSRQWEKTKYKIAIRK